MKSLLLFTDGSVHTPSKIGYGAYLLVEKEVSFQESLSDRVQVKRFEATSSTRLELQTLLWAWTEIQAIKAKVVVYTDSQNLIGLPARRSYLEANAYRSRKNRLLNNHDLYRAFFELKDLLNCELIKVKGHMVASKQREVDRFFRLVDQASRKALRENI